MQTTTLALTLLALCCFGFILGRGRSLNLYGARATGERTHSLPKHYGYMVLAWVALPGFLLLFAWMSLEAGFIQSSVLATLPESTQQQDPNTLGLYYNQVVAIANGELAASVSDEVQLAAAQTYRQATAANATWRAAVVLLCAVIGGGIAFTRVAPTFRARVHVEAIIRAVLFSCSFIALLTTLGIVLSVLFEALRFFQIIPALDFLFGLDWSPQMAIRADQVAASGSFGFVPLLTGTLLISSVAMFIAVPVGLMSAIYLSEYASRRFRAVTKPVLEILAGVPTVVYGFFAALTVAPLIRGWGESLGLSVASESALAAGLVMGIMIIPFVMSLSDDILSAVPRSMREASLGMGATMNETIRKVLLPAALPGIVGGILLAVSRAIGETMIVVMAAGLSAKLTANPLEAVTTITVQIVTLLVGDQEFDSPKTLAAFALGLVLFFVTLTLNVIALYVVRRYREQYE